MMTTEMPLADPGIRRVLDSLEKKVDALSGEIKDLDSKLDRVTFNVVTKAEFDAHQVLRTSIHRWAISVILTVVTVLVAISSIIVNTH
jgi:hypothetical protein